ncbi:MAG TPA: hypothetical protein VGQ56_12935 [Gemmatimonadaceae bacterium]|nr:hypothetical protein [Gemmatimonadaceae bacterium]
MKKKRARGENRARARASRGQNPAAAVDARLRWAGALGMSSVLLFALQSIFVALHQRIIAAKPAIDPALITPWARWAVATPDGVELPVASAGMLAFLAGTAGLAWFGAQTRQRAVSISACALGFLLALVIVSGTRSSEFLPPVEPSTVSFLIAAGAALLWLAHLVASRATTVWRVIAGASSAIALMAAIVLSLPAAAVVDYSYYIGPALKHMQGERIGSFYMQYDLLGTMLFEGLMRLRLQLHQMQLVMAVLLAAWYGLYWLLIRRLFRNRSIGLMLFLALVIVRFLNIRDHPAFVPQVGPHRLDMWVLLVLLASRWGLNSLKTSVVFAASYALDSTFGFLAAGAYVLALLLQAFSQRATTGTRATVQSVGARLAPIAVVAAAQKVVFGSIVSPAAAYYLDVKLGFMPIAATSLFWPIALLLGWATATFVVHRQESSSRWGLMICLFAVMQLTYFFGRSHDHNLLNISSVWLFAIFLAIDQATELGAFALPIGAALVVLAALMGAQQSAPKFVRIADRLRRGVWIETHPVERQVEMYRSVASPKTMLLDLADAYYNYRLNLPQRGSFAPFNANVFVEQTAIMLDDQLGDGAVPIALDPIMPPWIGDLNRAAALKTRGHQFVGYRYQGTDFVGIQRAPRP